MTTPRLRQRQQFPARFALTCLLAVGCKNAATDLPPPFTTSLTLGGRTVSAAQLNHGARVYTQYCRPCHGVAGDGAGPSALGLRPPPRDLRLGVYKFGGVAAGQLPSDADFSRIIRGGLQGTAMLAWDVPPAEVDDLIQYVKSFAPRWRNESAGEPITAAPDPWLGREADAVQRGQKVYHGLAQCAVACHPAYATKPEIYAATKALTGMSIAAFRADLYQPVAKDSDYGVKILPPDFTFNRLRAGETLNDIYRSIAAGIGGTAMPTWKNVLPEADLWALARYVRSLVDLRDDRRADELQGRLLAQPAWTPPPPPGADGGAGDGGGEVGADGTNGD
ncbi:MAG TPA: c-type cytochrome [Polyangia bacterium]